MSLNSEIKRDKWGAILNFSDARSCPKEFHEVWWSFVRRNQTSALLLLSAKIHWKAIHCPRRSSVGLQRLCLTYGEFGLGKVRVCVRVMSSNIETVLFYCWIDIRQSEVATGQWLKQVTAVALWVNGWANMEHFRRRIHCIRVRVSDHEINRDH